MVEGEYGAWRIVGYCQSRRTLSVMGEPREADDHALNLTRLSSISLVKEGLATNKAFWQVP